MQQSQAVLQKRKINKKWKFNVNYFNFIFEDRAVLVAQHHELIHAQIAVLDLTYKINRKHSLRWEEKISDISD